MTDADLLTALRDCYDPVLRRNIVELGFVRAAAVAADREAPGAGIAGVPPRYRARVVLQPASADEAAAAQLQAQVENRLAGMAEISAAEVTLLPPAFAILR